MYTVFTASELTTLRFTVEKKGIHPMNSRLPAVLLIEDDFAAAEARERI